MIAPDRLQSVEWEQIALVLWQAPLPQGEDASLRILGFTNSPCPKGARCVWSGQAVHLELTVAGVLDADGAVALEQDAGDQRLGADHQVGPMPRRPE